MIHNYPFLHRLFLGMLTLGLIYFAATLTPSRAGDSQFRVINVAADDVLNVRASPIATSDKIASLTHDAINISGTGRTRTIGNAEWREIRIGTQTGWVNTHFLAQMETSQQSPRTLFRIPLTCSGTEPFWGLQVKHHQAELDSLNEGKITIHFRSSRQPGGVPNIWSLRGETKATHSSVIAILEETNSCSDGMSDLLYQYSIRLDVADGPFFAGCCNRLPGQPDP